MISLVRTASLAALVGLAACAPAKLSVIPAPAYDPAVGGDLSADQRQLVANLQEAVKVRSAATVVAADPSATLAARYLLNQLIENGTAGVLPSQGRDLLHEAGIADLGARFMAKAVGYNDRVPVGEDLAPMVDSLGAFGAHLAVGVADLPAPMMNKRLWALVVVPRVVALKGVARRWEPGTKVEVAGAFLEAVTNPHLHLLKPDGVADAYPLAVGADGAFSQTLDLPGATGQYVLEIGGWFQGANRVLVAAPVGVGLEPMAWPPRAADVDAAAAPEIQQALVKILGDIRAKPLAERKDLSDAAEACAKAQVEGQPCAQAETVAVAAFDVPADGVERGLSEIAAMPCTRVLWNAEAAGIAVAPTKGGAFVVTLALGTVEGKTAPAPEPTPAAAPEPTPVAAPAPTPAPEATPSPLPQAMPAGTPEPAQGAK